VLRAGMFEKACPLKYSSRLPVFAPAAPGIVLVVTSIVITHLTRAEALLAF